jgi:hypothetical protein
MAIENALESAIAGKAADAVVIIGSIALGAAIIYAIYTWWSSKTPAQQAYDLMTSNPITQAGYSMRTNISAAMQSGMPQYLLAADVYTTTPTTPAQLESDASQSASGTAINITPQGIGGAAIAVYNGTTESTPFNPAYGWQGSGWYLTKAGVSIYIPNSVSFQVNKNTGAIA